MASEIVRVLRLIEYVGSREAVEAQLTRSSYFPGGIGTRTMEVTEGQGTGRQSLGRLTMSSALLTQWPELLLGVEGMRLQAVEDERDLYYRKYSDAVNAIEPLHTEKDLVESLGLRWGCTLTSDGVAALVAEVKKLRDEVVRLKSGLSEIADVVSTPPGMESK